MFHLQPSLHFWENKNASGVMLFSHILGHFLLTLSSLLEIGDRK